MIQNELRTQLERGQTVFGCFTRYRDPALTEFMAMQGWDFLVFDGEHGTLEPRDIEEHCRAAEVRSVTPIARVTTNQPHIILRYLDTGVHGIHVPWVNTPAEVEQAVTSVKYQPRGERGLAGSRASDWGMTEPIADYTRRANRETLLVIHIETAEAVAAVEEFVDIDGVDVLFVGPTDLSHSLGHPGEATHPDVVRAIERVRDVVVPSDKTFGIFAGTPDTARHWEERGARYFATTPDRFLASGMQGYLAAARGEA